MNQGIVVTVDVVLMTLKDRRLQVVLLERERDPFKKRLALPGGYIHGGADIDAMAAAERVLAEKTGLVSPYLEQLYTFTGGARDPRGWSISITYFALVNSALLEEQSSANFKLLPAEKLPRLPFDHNQIVAFAVDRVRAKSGYSALPCYLLPQDFTLAELQETYEVLLGNRLDKSSFRRKVEELAFLLPAGVTQQRSKRPAQLYRLVAGTELRLFDRAI